jgi:hypothetical protein
MVVAVLVTASVVVVSGTMPALAAEPGEDSSWTSESVNHGQTLNSPDTYGEARSPVTSALVQIYRGEDNRVWIGVDNGLSSRPEGVPTPP